MRPDLVILDVNLEKGNGINVIKRLKAIDSRARVLAYSLHHERDYEERALRAGAMGYLARQEPAAAMLQAIRDVLQDKLHFSPQVVQRTFEQAGPDTANSERSSPIDRLSNRELAVFELMGSGLNAQAIAERLRISPRTVDTYRERLKVKLELASSAELHRQAVEWVLADS